MINPFCEITADAHPGGVDAADTGLVTTAHEPSTLNPSRPWGAQVSCPILGGQGLAAGTGMYPGGVDRADTGLVPAAPARRDPVRTQFVLHKKTKDLAGPTLKNKPVLH